MDRALCYTGRKVVDRYNFIINKKTREEVDCTDLAMLAVFMKLCLIFVGLVDAFVCIVLVVQVADSHLAEEQ